MRFFTLLPAAALFEMSIAGYVLQDDYMTDFFGGFDFFTGPDPTEGFVKYVDEATARKTNLINTTSYSGVQWGVDTQNQTPKGRPSVRITSKNSYDSGLIVLDVAHMPFGCGTWPAFWTVGPNWPRNGEIDILEGVNDQTNNAMTLHTGPGCQIGEDTTQFAGTVDSENCDVAAKGQSKNKGCSIEHPSTKSYGAGLNAIGGGVYATQWTDDAISVFYFPRDAVPEDVLGDNPNPSGWGKPAAKFTGGCDIAQTFKKQQLVFDTTFCGQWAGSQSAWESSSCSKKASTCEEYVRDNPEAFAEAYWTINALKVYQDNGEAPVSPAPTSPAKSSAIPTVVPVPTIKTSSSIEAPVVSSQYAVPSKIPTSPAPAIPTTSKVVLPSTSEVALPSTSEVALPSTSEVAIPPTSAVVAPIPTSDVTPEEPVATPTASAAPLPSNETTQVPPKAPEASKTDATASPVKPTRPAGPQRPAPTGANGMPGFQWPMAGGGGNQSDNTPPASTTAAAPLPEGTDTPEQNPSNAVIPPSPTDTTVQPSNAAPLIQVPAPAPTTTDNAPPTVPVVTNTVEAVKTVYETVYATVTYDPEATPVPAARKARMARHVRGHRQRLTRHHAR
ncbi:glycoside hydrolase family 16 protein [Plenodomus tracheiphilus IPT5]|uniref:endo-1,3(4)-beta-glucanase n=1 Tax=Plenodomus tracheiphilus IPT5 TaxID=1408161 RepID=A0A6A7BLY3_9PLEO|nr:glycoside hydrolase family 16 protein [Plenodomus tracheiphilus IPT5]